jgi:LPS O-antigen subunit length determinant protein (WzzB/FepE family)
MNNKENTKNTEQYDDEIGLKELFTVLWASKVTIIAITTVFAVASVFYSLSIPNQYKATVSLTSAQQDSGGLSGALNQFGGLASIAGINIGGSDSRKTQITKEIMTSRSFIENFIDANDISAKLGAVIGWDKESNQLMYNQDAYDSQTQSWLTDDGAPSSWDLYQSFSGMLAIEQQMDLVMVSLEHYSPYLAKEWLDLYLEAINKHMQARQVLKVSNNIEYLQRQIKKTSVSEMQAVFYTIIEEQMKSKMLAEANPDYAFVVVASSMVPEQRSRPKRALICIFGTLMGGMLSVMWVFVLRLFRSLN